MKRIVMVMVLAALPACSAWANSAYENLAYALRQQQITDDLRVHCDIPTRVTDAQLRQVFLQDEQRNSAILTAAKALKANKKPEYQAAIKQVECPPEATQ